MVSLNFEQAGFHYCGASQSPKQAGQPQHQLPLNGRLSIIVGDDGRFERFVILRILKRTDHVSAVRPWRTATVRKLLPVSD